MAILFRKICALTTIVLFLVSCSKNKDSLGYKEDVSIIKVKAELIDFNTGSDLGSKNAAIFGSLSKNNSIQDTVIDLNDEFMLTAELVPAEDNTSPLPSNRINKTNKIAASSALPNNIWYRLYVFTQNDGKFKAVRTYQRGNEDNSNVEPLKLDGGVTYTFVAYSVNSDVLADLPTIKGNLADIDRILSTSTIDVLNHKDLLFFKENITVTGEETQNLNINFKHLFNHITVSVDASETGYAVTNMTAKLTSPQGTANIHFTDGVIARTGNATDAPLSFIDLGNSTHIVNANGLVINATGENILSISNIVVGDIISGSPTVPLIPFSSVTLEKGYKYKLKLKITPKDKLLTYQGQLATQIGDQIWMRLNLGATSTTPDIINSNIHGYYFQWGQITHSATKTSTSQNPFLSSNNPPINTWNSGTENIPVKTTHDPCPTGYRVPTAQDYTTLINNTNTSNNGPFTSPANEFGSAKVFTSKRNTAAKLTFPAEGFFTVSGTSPYNDAGLSSRGSVGRYHTSTASTTSPILLWLRFEKDAVYIANTGTNTSSKVSSFSVRCIAEKHVSEL